MTGYGKARAEADGREITVEIKAVNHRYLDLSIKSPRIFQCYDDKIRKAMGVMFSRGHFDVYISYNDTSERDREVIADVELAKKYCDAIDLVAQGCNMDNDIKLSGIIRFPDILKTQMSDEVDEVWGELLDKALSLAGSELDAMRCYEGEKLKADMLKRIDAVESAVDSIKVLAPQVVEEYRKKLNERVAEALKGEVDESRLAMEVAVFADKSDITEELTRLNSHIGHFRHIAASDTPSGRQLDFLVQELNREVNTVCSKSNNIKVTEYGLALKNEIEKIREQVQNIE